MQKRKLNGMHIPGDPHSGRGSSNFFLIIFLVTSKPEGVLFVGG
jgi:hypothetical protein